MADPDVSGERPTELQTLKETYLLTPRGGFFDARNQNRDPEPSVEPPRHSAKPTNLEILSFVIGSKHDLREKRLERKRAPPASDESGPRVAGPSETPAPFSRRGGNLIKY